MQIKPFEKRVVPSIFGKAAGSWVFIPFRRSPINNDCSIAGQGGSRNIKLWISRRGNSRHDVWVWLEARYWLPFWGCFPWNNKKQAMKQVQGVIRNFSGWKFAMKSEECNYHDIIFKQCHHHIWKRYTGYLVGIPNNLTVAISSRVFSPLSPCEERGNAQLLKNTLRRACKSLSELRDNSTWESRQALQRTEAIEKKSADRTGDVNMEYRISMDQIEAV